MNKLERHKAGDDQPDCPPDMVPGTKENIGLTLLPTLDFPPDPKLAEKGWERRFMADPSRAKEASSIYRELGFEVRSEEILPSELSVLCGDCRLATCRSYVTIYTRRAPQQR
jgi:hypothetical protein